MTLPFLLSALIFLPLLAGAFVLLLGEDENPGFARGTALAVSVANMLLSLVLLAPSLRFEEKLPWLPQFGIGYHLRVDGLSLWLILLVTFMTPAAVLASWKLIQSRAKVYYGCMLLLSGGMVGVLCAMDLFLFYVFWEIMLIPAFFLVGVYGTGNARATTMKFVIYTMVGSLLMLVGVVFAGYQHFAATGVWTFDLPSLYGQAYAATGVAGAAISSVGHWAFLAFVSAFVIKAAMFPLHTWLPDTYTDAPAPVTFLLSAVMAKLGIYGILRLAIPLFPDAARDFGPFFIGLAVIGVIYGALVALVQEDAKRMIAYASISHLGIITMAVFTTSPQAVSGAVLHMIAHALTTGALFLLVGFLYERKGTTMIAAYGGITKTIPVFATVFLLVTLASVGLPGLAGFVGEFMIFLGAFRDHSTAATIATISVILGASYMLWMFQRTMFGPLTAAENTRLPDMNGRELTIFVPMALLIIFIGVYPQALLARINPAVTSYLSLTRPAPSRPFHGATTAPAVQPAAAPHATEAAHGAGGH
jgi:NADH-quinone oxidoreductase subunit M